MERVWTSQDQHSFAASSGEINPIQPSRATVGPTFAVAATFTAEPIDTALRFWMSELNQAGAVEFAQFNQVFQVLLDPAGLMSRKNFANAVLVRIEDWIEGDRSSLAAAEWKTRLTPLVDELLSAARAIPRPAATFVVVCPPSIAVTGDPEVSAVIDQLTRAVLEGLRRVAGIYAFGPREVESLYPVQDYYDAGADAVGHIPYTQKYFAVLGTFLARMAVAVRRSPFKVIVLDCDNTLWSGVCGEGGVSAVTVSSGFRAMQQFMLKQATDGKILCLCSKNVEADVWDIFENHADMLLKRDHIVARRVNWSPKSQNLRELANELNLGLDSFIFIDDNPVECAEVRASCPEVLTLQAPASGEDWPGFLNHIWAFDQLTVTDQDRQRAASYQQNARREEIRKESAGLDDFLARLQLQVSITPLTPANLPRVAQLTERTNQFNFSTIRRSESELSQLLSDDRNRCDVVEVKDRFGDYGLVGVLITTNLPDELTVDTMLLSCRVLGRGVEHQMIAHLGHRAKDAGLATVRIPFVRSAKNQPAMDFVKSIAADFSTDTSDGFICQIPSHIAAAVKAMTSSAPPAETETQPASAVDVQGITIPYQFIAESYRDAEAINLAIEAMPAVARKVEKSDPVMEPRDEKEKQLTAIWCRVLKLPKVGIRDDYFALGGTSVLAVRLVLDIEKVFGRQLPIATLLKAPTIEQLAKCLEEPVAADDLAMVTLRVEGAGPPLLLMPGIGGHVLRYKRLVELLKTDQPVYGFEMRPEISANLVPRSIQQMADEFVSRILTVLPNGPYFLAGWSFGGMLAFEIAQQLIGAGKTVNLVVLFDTWNNGYPRQLSRAERVRLHVRKFVHRSVAENLRYITVTGGVVARTMWHRVLKFAGVRKTDFYQYESPATEQLVAVCDAASKKYRPQPLPARLALLRAMKWPDLIGLSYADPQNGWGGLASEIGVYPVQTDHLGLFDEPAVRETAAQLEKSFRAYSKTDSTSAAIGRAGYETKGDLIGSSSHQAKISI